MKRHVVSLLVLSALPQIASAQGQVVSYHLPPGTGDRVLTTTPLGGLVITDIVIFASTGIELLLEQVDSEGTKEKFYRQGVGTELHFKSGLVFDACSTIQVNANNGTQYAYTIAGYIPAVGPGNVPAVSTWGIIILGMLILIVGGSVLTRRRTA